MPTQRIGGIDYEYSEDGEGPPIVFASDDPAAFAEHVEALREHHRCVCIGLWGPDADALIGVVDALLVERPVYAGQGIGREAVLAVASSYPEEVAALVLAGPAEEGGDAEVAVPVLKVEEPVIPVAALRDFLEALRTEVGTA